MIKVDVKEFVTDHCILGFYLGCSVHGDRVLRWNWAWPNGALIHGHNQKHGYNQYPTKKLPWHRCWRWM